MKTGARVAAIIFGCVKPVMKVVTWLKFFLATVVVMTRSGGQLWLEWQPDNCRIYDSGKRRTIP